MSWSGLEHLFVCLFALLLFFFFFFSSATLTSPEANVLLMQYFGYLRRDVDQGGYDFWLDVVNNRELNDYRGMVCAFITSSEYQLRFGTVATRSNADCGQ